MAAVDVAVAGRRPGRARRLRGAPAPAVGPRRHAPDAARAVRVARGDRWPRRPDAVLVRTGVVLPRPVAVPAARPGHERAALRSGVHDPGRLVSGDLAAGPGAHRAPRPDRAGDRR